MSNFFILLKNNINITFGLPKLRVTFAKKPFLSKFLPVLMVLLYLGLFALAFLYIYFYGAIFMEAGAPEGILIMGICLGSFLSLILNVTQTSGYLFGAKDYDLLMGLPVKHRDIIASKMAYLLIFNYLILSFIYLPAMIVYGIFAGPGIIFYILGLVLFIFLPFIPVTISGFISYLLGFISGKLKYKNILTILALVVFLVFVMTYSMQMNQYQDDQDAIVSMIQGMIWMFYPGKFAFEGLTGNALFLLGYIVASGFIYATLILIVSKNYAKANERAKRVYRNKNFVLTEQKTTSGFFALVKKELRMYYTKPMYVMNTLVGPIMAVIIPVVFLLQADSLLIIESAVSAESVLLILMIMITFMCSLTSTTAVSISLEGKRLWILRSLPVSVRDIFVSKIIVNLTATLPFILLANIAIWILFPVPVSMYHIFLILIPTVVAFIISIGGLYINLLFPKFDWDVEIKVIKQSVSVLMSVLLGFLLVGVGAGLFILLSDLLDTMYLMFIITAIYMLFVVLFIWLLEKDGTKRFLKL